MHRSAVDALPCGGYQITPGLAITEVFIFHFLRRLLDLLDQFALTVTITQLSKLLPARRDRPDRGEVGGFVLHVRRAIDFIPELITPCFKNALEACDSWASFIYSSPGFLGTAPPQRWRENIRDDVLRFCPFLAHACFSLTRTIDPMFGENQVAINSRCFSDSNYSKRNT